MKFFASKRTQRLTNFALAALLVLSTMTASVPFLFSNKADAAPGVSYTTPALSTSDWTVDRSVPSGGWSVDTSANQRVILNVNQLHANTSAPFYQTEGVSKALSTGTDSIKADLYVAADWSTKPSLRVGLWGVAQDTGNTGPSYPIIEYVNLGGYIGWRVWNANDGTWTNVVATTNVGGQNTVEIVSNFNTGNYDFYVNNSKVYSYSADGYTTFTNMIFNNYNAATGDASGNYSVIWKNIATGSLPKVAACSATNTYETVNLNNWNLGDTRATGHNQLVPNGLHVWTEGATSTDKAAGYFATNFALQDAGVPAINFASTSGGTPGLQMAVDFDNNGATDGILVGESVYGNDWWLSNSAAQFVKDGAPLHTGGSGSVNHGTLNAWLAAFPNARVKSVGYSLGSGVLGNDVISSMTYGCVNYTFDVDTEKPVINTVYGTPASTLNNAGSVNVVASDNGGLKKISFTVDGTSKYAVLNVAGNTTTAATLTKTIGSLGLADGTYTVKAAAEDLNGNFAVPKTLTIIIDNVAPTVTIKPESVGSIPSNTFKNVSFKLFDANKIDRLTLNGAEKNLTDGIWSDLNGVTVGSFGAVEGSNTLVVYDVAGNATTYSFTIDTTGPATPTLVSPADGASKNGGPTQVWADSNPGDVAYYIYQSFSDAALTVPVYSTTTTGTHRTIGGTQNTTIYWRVIAVDALGNRSAPSDAWKLVIDNTAPTASIAFPARGSSATSFTVTYSEAMNYDDATNPANYFLANWPGAGGSGDLSGHATITYDAASNTATVHFTTPGWYVSGEQLWGVSGVRDLADNAITTVSAFSSDNLSPAAPTNIATTTPTKSLTSVWTWDTATDPENVTNGASGVKGYEYQLTQQGVATNYTAWVSTTATTATTTVSSEGDYVLHVRAIDNAGNVGNESTGDLTVDTTGPTINVNPGTSASNQPAITGTVGSDTDHVNVTIEDVNGNQVDFGPAIYVVNGTTWSYAVQNPLANGTYTVFARAYDTLGNYTDNSALVTVAVTPTTNQPASTVSNTQTPTITSLSAAAVLGATTDTPNGTGAADVKGTTDDKTASAVNSDANQGKVFGLAWYWWILILAALASIAWYIAAAVRRHNEANA